MTTRVDVLVVGAGPAGCAAAVALARAGRDVLVCDKATFPRDKCCGDGLTTGALRRLESVGVDVRDLPSWQSVDSVSVRSPSGRPVRVPLPARPGVFGGVCRREELDAALVEAARRAGARVEEGCRFEALETGGPGGTLVSRFAGGPDVEARFVVAADGAWSPVRRAAGDQAADRGPKPYLGEWHAFRRYFHDVGPEAASHLWIWFDRAVLPGYAWSFPLAGGSVNVGVTLRREAGTTGAELKARVAAVYASPWFRSLAGRHARADAAERSWPIPARCSGSPLTALDGRVMFVGDAARLADPLTGEGVGQALESGEAAARAVAFAEPDSVAEAYEAAVAGALSRDNRLAKLLSDAMARPLLTRAAVRGATLPVAQRRFGAWLFEDYPRAFALTPRRWGRGTLGRPGAYAGRTA
jgi:geranylgeranyl reductase family protein